MYKPVRYGLLVCCVLYGGSSLAGNSSGQKVDLNQGLLEEIATRSARADEVSKRIEAPERKKITLDLPSTRQLEQEKNTDEERWSSFLPFWGSLAEEIGAELPLPFGISATYVGLDVPLYVNRAELFVAENSLVELGRAAIDSGEAVLSNYSIKVDALVLPFLNVFASYGPTSGSVPLSLDVPVSALPTPLNLGAGLVTRGDNIVIDSAFDFEGSTTGVGAALVGGIPLESGTIFGFADITYIYTDLDIVETTIKGKLITYRLGWDSYFDGKRFQLFGGIMDHQAKQQGNLPISGLNLPVLRDVSVTIDVEDRTGYTPMVGGAITLAPNWLLAAEYRFGGRTLLNGVVNYRF